MRSKVFAGGRFTTLTALKLLSCDIMHYIMNVHHGNGKCRHTVLVAIKDMYRYVINV